MMDLRKRIFIITSVVVGIFIVAILLYLFFSRPTADQTVLDNQNSQQVDNVSNNTAGVNGGTISNNPNGQPNTPTTPVDPDELYTKQLSRIFVERFASYSNQNDNANLETILPLSTDKMARWLKTQFKTDSTDYSGVTTKVIVSSVLDLTDSTAVVKIEAQQIISTVDTQEKLQRSGKVNLLKVNGEWKVDGFFWD